jgi:hypothetical protein
MVTWNHIQKSRKTFPPFRFDSISLRFLPREKEERNLFPARNVVISTLRLGPCQIVRNTVHMPRRAYAD